MTETMVDEIINHHYRGFEFVLSFKQKDAVGLTITVSLNMARHPHVLTISRTLMDVYDGIRNDDELKDQLCELCLYENKLIDPDGSVRED